VPLPPSFGRARSPGTPLALESRCLTSCLPSAGAEPLNESYPLRVLKNRHGSDSRFTARQSGPG
jgi:hypothetical protein